MGEMRGEMKDRRSGWTAFPPEENKQISGVMPKGQTCASLFERRRKKRKVILSLQRDAHERIHTPIRAQTHKHTNTQTQAHKHKQTQRRGAADGNVFPCVVVLVLNLHQHQRICFWCLVFGCSWNSG